MAFGKNKYYRLDEILKLDASYNMIVGQRSNGKTYAALEYGLKKYFEDGSQLAYIRRWDEDIRGKRGSTVFDGLVYNGVITKLSKGKWDGVYYYSGRWFLSKTDKEKDRITTSTEPFGFAFSLNSMEHDKSTSYPKVRNIIFDEFLTRNGGLTDEFILFQNVLSTIIRDPSRTDVKIFMLANTVNWDSEYFTEMGITDIRKMKQGTIDLYQYGEGYTTVAVEYCAEMERSETADRYFAFNNPRLKMITTGVWEMDIYPHCPVKYRPKDILFTYFIKYRGDLLQCEIVQTDECVFTFIHRKTTPIQRPNEDLIYDNEWNAHPNVRRNVLKPLDNAGRQIKEFFVGSKIFYQNNEVGEIINNYLEWCKTN